MVSLRKLSSLFLLTSLLGACASAPIVPQEREDVVDLRFQWEPGATASVRSLRTTTDISPRGHYQDQVRSRYRLSSEREGERTRLVWEDLQIDLLPSRWIPRTVEMVALEIGKADFLVTDVGTFAEVEEPVAAQARVAKWAAEAAMEDASARRVHARVVELFSEEAIITRTEGFWDELVGIWSGGKMEVGQRYEARDEIAVDGLGGVPLEMVVEFVFHGWVPCAPNERELACVRLTSLATPAPEQRPLLMHMTSMIFDGDTERETRVEQGVELITEPEGLRPRRVRVHRAVEIPLLEGDSIVIADESDLIFEWRGG